MDSSVNKPAQQTAQPKLRFPEFRGETGWERKALSKVCYKITQGGTPDTSNSSFWNRQIQWLTPVEMGKNNFRFIGSSLRQLTEKGLQNCSSDLLPINSIIISTRAPIGHLMINSKEMAINQGCKGIIPDKSTDHNFLYYILSTSKQKLLDLGAGNTFKELSYISLKNFYLDFPSYKEQQRIADCFSSIDEFVLSLAQSIDALKEHKKGLMQQLFPTEDATTPKLRFKEFKGVANWEAKPLYQLCAILSKKTKCITSDNRKKGIYPYYGAGGIIDYIDDYIFDERLLLLTCKGSAWGAFKSTAFIAEGKYWVSTTAHILKPHDIIDTLLKYYLIKIDLHPFVEGISPPGLPLKALKELIIPFSHSRQEQQRITDCLSSIDELIELQNQKLGTLKEHKKGLMQQLFPQTN